MIASIKVGERVEITGLGYDNLAYRAKLLSMGLLPGTVFTIIRKAPLGDPIEIQVRGYRLSLRQKEAALLQIKKVN